MPAFLSQQLRLFLLTIDSWVQPRISQENHERLSPLRLFQEKDFSRGHKRPEVFWENSLANNINLRTFADKPKGFTIGMTVKVVQMPFWELSPCIWVRTPESAVMGHAFCVHSGPSEDNEISEHKTFASGLEN